MANESAEFSIHLDRLTTYQIKELLETSGKKWGLLLPVGSLEQHGPYLPIGCDMKIARGAAVNLAKRLNDNKIYGALVLPDFSYTPCPGADAVYGTVSVGFNWFGNGLKEIVQNAVKTPWAYIAIINSHAFNHGRVIEASIAATAGDFGPNLPVIVINVYDFMILSKAVGLEPGKHAGEFELALYHYYGGTIKTSGSCFKVSPKKQRPPNIFGLPILKRSDHGVISNQKPRPELAMQKSQLLGKKLDKEILTVLINNLDLFYANWNEQ